jgi:hypothetical protein
MMRCGFVFSSICFGAIVTFWAVRMKIITDTCNNRNKSFLELEQLWNSLKNGTTIQPLKYLNCTP